MASSSQISGGFLSVPQSMLKDLIVEREGEDRRFIDVKKLKPIIFFYKPEYDNPDTRWNRYLKLHSASVFTISFLKLGRTECIESMYIQATGKINMEVRLL
jgi:hypothetical protein